jgi:predicted DNA-binding protein
MNSDLEKRAAEFTNVPGSLEVRVAMLKGIESIEDETLRAEALKSLTAQNEQMASAFETIGKAGGSVLVPGSVDAQLDALAVKYREAHPGASEAIAMDAVLKSAEGSALYTKSLN